MKYDTVRQYIRNHPDLFQGHIGRRNKIVLDEVAVSILDKKYPAQTQIEIVQNDELLQQIVLIQNENNELKLQLATQDYYKNLLKEKEEDLAFARKAFNNSSEHCKELRIELFDERDKYNELRDDYKSLQDDYNKLKEDYISEKNKSWWDKLMGR